MQDWRIARRNAWRTMQGFTGTENAGTEIEFAPLPYDEELGELEKAQSAHDSRENYEIMQEAIKSNYFNTPIWQKGTS